jgi:Histidine kinase-like ATPase domain
VAVEVGSAAVSQQRATGQPGATGHPGHVVQCYGRGRPAEWDQPWRTAVSRTFGCAVAAPREARHFMAHLLRQWQLDGGHRGAGQGRGSRLATDVALVVSELAANAVLHARTAFTVSATLSEDGVYLSVADRRPLPAGQDSLPVRGDHGLGLISRITDRWGVGPVPGGKAVWAHLPLPG